MVNGGRVSISIVRQRKTHFQASHVLIVLVNRIQASTRKMNSVTGDCPSRFRDPDPKKPSCGVLCNVNLLRVTEFPNSSSSHAVLGTFPPMRHGAGPHDGDLPCPAWGHWLLLEVSPTASGPRRLCCAEYNVRLLLVVSEPSLYSTPLSSSSGLSQSDASFPDHPPKRIARRT